MQQPKRGYLLLADVTGFTAFLADAELVHAQAILEQVLETLVSSLTPALTLSEVEGDAVFVYGLESRVTRGELVVELAEAAYAAFRDLQRTMLRNATCPCRACRSIGELDLKLVIHFGEFAFREVAGRSAPMGSSVNLVHRLLKNSVTEATGWRGYLLFSEAALAEIPVSPDGLYASEERYEHLGTIRTFSSDLHHRYQDMLAERRTRLTADETHAELVYDFDMPPAVVWDWLNDTAKRTRWMQRSNWLPMVRPGGRTGRGAENHCSGFNVMEQILDWRPFDYYTARFVGRPLRLVATVALEPLPAGTRVRWQMRIENRLPLAVCKLLGQALITRRMRLPQGFASMSEMMSQASPTLVDQAAHPWRPGN
jgi:class 3 adenylate cyclase